MPASTLSLVVRLHRYGFLLTADVVSADSVLNKLLAEMPANDLEADMASRERELFRQYTFSLQSAAPQPNTNLHFLPTSAPASPASFAAALWGLPFTARALIILVCVEGFSLAEAAFIVNLPLNRAEHFMLDGLFRLGPDPE